jgi:long-chain fatty acid transport protein
MSHPFGGGFLLNAANRYVKDMMRDISMRGDKVSRLLKVVVFAVCTCFPTWSWAGALYVYEMGSPADIGTAGAGMAAKAQNASTAFTNPAGMMRFDGPELLVSGVGMYLHAPFEPDNNMTVVGSDGQTNELFGAGSLSYAHPVTSRLNVGLTAQNNFGLALNWSSQWVGRYQSVNEWLIAPQVQPTVAYKVNDWLSVGGGPAFTLGYISEKKRVANLDPARGDGKLRYSDSEFAVQGNFGIMIEPDPQTRIGLRYLTETKLNFKDGLNLSNVGPIVSQAKSASLKLGVRM